MRNLEGTAADYYYGHDHLYSPAVLFNNSGKVKERYEYDAYGAARIMDDSFGARSSSDYSNSYLFTGRRLDRLDGGDLKIMYYRARYYDTYTGRFLQRDPLGLDPARANFDTNKHYNDGMNFYEYAKGNSINRKDSLGLLSSLETGCDIIMKEFRRERNKKLRELGLGSLFSALKFPKSMPFAHCMFNCRGAMKHGQEWAKNKSKLKEELDNIYADYAVKLRDAGCWEGLSEEEKGDFCRAARSADQPSYLQDNASGRECAEEAEDVVRCATPSGAPQMGYKGGGGTFSTMKSYCRDCCRRKGVGPNTCDGPPLRGWGPRMNDVADICAKYNVHDPGPGTGCDGTDCDVNQY